ncbi:hypothetical protein DBR32_09490 [Taibaiella sp. KBW10]|uniref:hypothetical protein n=1 Tax=Taibaiella sp. KBW10 TaxID=2153357 RepID=UPI000F59CD85|nr:hypothetical protein [Taibaiella sp. KBW10]RQO30934.1 hypothetical protein DBR32_09490 [Taibaiella sp. KBW10]
MNVKPKHIATFLLGVAAGAAALKYAKMSDEEKEKLTDNLKDKANKFKDEAETSFDKAKEYFAELSTKGTDSLKEYWAEAESYIKDLINKKEKATDIAADAASDIKDTVKNAGSDIKDAVKA